MDHEAPAFQREHETARRHREGQPAADIGAEPGLRVAAVTAHAERKARRQGRPLVVERHRPRALNPQAHTRNVCLRSPQVAAIFGQRGDFLRGRPDPARIRDRVEFRAVAIHQCPASPGRGQRHGDVGLLCRLVHWCQRRQGKVARAIAERTPDRQPIRHAVARPWRHRLHRRLDLARLVAAIVAFATAVRQHRAAGPGTARKVRAQQARGHVAVETEPGLAAGEARLCHPAPDRGRTAVVRLPGNREGRSHQQLGQGYSPRLHPRPVSVLRLLAQPVRQYGQARLGSVLGLQLHIRLRRQADGLSGHADRDPGRARGAQALLDRIQHLPRDCSPEARKPRLRHRVVVLNRACRAPVGNDRARRARQGEREGLLALVHRVVEHRDPDGLGRLARGEGQRAALRRVVRTRLRAAVRSGVVHPHRARRRPAQRHCEVDGRVGPLLRPRIRHRKRHRAFDRHRDGVRQRLAARSTDGPRRTARAPAGERHRHVAVA